MPYDITYKLLSGDVSIGHYRTTATLLQVSCELKKIVVFVLSLNWLTKMFYMFTLFFLRKRFNAGMFDKDVIIENNLDYRRKDDVLVRVKGTSIFPVIKG